MADAPSQTAAFSLDGRAWQPVPLPSAAAWSAVCRTPRGFVAAAEQSGVGALSADGTVWHTFAVPSGGVRGLIRVNGLIAALPAAESAVLPVSEDGERWHGLTLPEGAVWKSLCSGGGVTLLTGDGAFLRGIAPLAAPQTGLDRPAVHPTGWNVHTMPDAGPWSFIDYCEDRFVALAAAAGKAAWSYDGEHWNLLTLPAAEAWQCMSYGGGRYIVLGLDGSERMLWSDDGSTWHESALPAADTWKTVCRSGGRFVALGSTSGSCALSEDGAAWQAVTISEAQGWVDAACTGDLIVAVGTSIAALSDDGGSTWSTAALPLSGTWSAVCHGGSGFVVVGDGMDSTLHSPDGLTWEACTLRDSTVCAFKGVCWEGGLYVAAEGGSANGVYVSPDGRGWEKSFDLPLAGGASSLCCGGRPAAVSGSFSLTSRGALSPVKTVSVSIGGTPTGLFGEHCGAVVAGTYIGNGVRTIDPEGGLYVGLGFTPSAVLIRPQTYGSVGSGCIIATPGCPAIGNDSRPALTIVENGFLAGERTTSSDHVNGKGFVYNYIAIR